jgi:hypothetical protein
VQVRGTYAPPLRPSAGPPPWRAAAASRSAGRCAACRRSVHPANAPHAACVSYLFRASASSRRRCAATSRDTDAVTTSGSSSLPSSLPQHNAWRGMRCHHARCWHGGARGAARRAHGRLRLLLRLSLILFLLVCAACASVRHGEPHCRNRTNMSRTGRLAARLGRRGGRGRRRLSGGRFAACGHCCLARSGFPGGQQPFHTSNGGRAPCCVARAAAPAALATRP